GRGGGENKLRSRFLQATHDLLHIFLILVGRNLSLSARVLLLLIDSIIWNVFHVVQAEVEVNHVPLLLAEPLIEFLNSAGGRATVFERAMDVRFAEQRLAHGRGIADRDRVADE